MNTQTLNPQNPAPEATPAATAQLLAYLRVLWKHKWVVVIAAIVGCGVAYLWTSRQPRIYQADCSIEYDPNPPRPLSRDLEEVSNQMMFWELREYFATQNKVLQSRTIAERVVRKLSLHENADFWQVPEGQRAAWRGASIADTARLLQSVLTVTQERDTRLVHIRVKDVSPERATLIANTIADVYIEKSMEDRLGATTSALDWLGKQLDGLKNQLEQSELALHEFSEQHTNLAVALEDQMNIVAANIGALSSKLIEAQTKRIELQARVNQLQSANRDDPFEFYASGFLDNPTVSQLRMAHQTLMREREARLVDYGEAHPKILALNQQLDSVKRAMRAEIDAMLASAQSELNEGTEIENGVRSALDRANRIGIELNLQEITHRRLERERDNTSKLYGTLLERTAQTDLTRAMQVSYVRIMDRAIAPYKPVSPAVLVNLSVGALLGLLLGIGLAFVLHQLDRTIRTVEEAEALGITILGIMPRVDSSSSILTPTYYGRKKGGNHSSEALNNRDLVVHTHPKSMAAECCRTIRTNLTFMSADKPRKTVVITSASPREGKTTLTLSLAISLAQSGKRVLIVDTDLRKPRMHRALGATLATGVTTVLVGEVSLKEAIQSTEIPGLSLLAAGPIPPNPSELLHTSHFRQLINDVSKQFDHVLFDSPPLAAVTDAAIIAPQVDSSILVLHGYRTTRDALRTALRKLRDVGCQPTGGVLNEVDLAANRYGYGSYYYYNREGYYEADASSNDDKPTRPVAQA